MKIVNINGPINSGKSTVSKELVKQIANSLFVEVDDLLSDEEQEVLGLSREQGWAERTNRLAQIVKAEKIAQNFENIVFAYPMTDNLYREWKAFEDTNTSFVNITLSPKLEICLQNRGERELDEWEIKRIKEMYAQGYQKPQFSDLIIDNSQQTPPETTNVVWNFLCQSSL